MNEQIKVKLEENLDVKINKVEIFEQALTHRSIIHVVELTEKDSNERLEFLGDSILGMITAEYLFSIHTDVDEGDLTKMRSRLVNKKVLGEAARSLHLDSLIRMSYGAMKLVEQGNLTILADCLEAIIAAIYIDSGIENARKFIIKTLMPIFMDKEIFDDRNYKSILLELVQAKGYEFPRYEVIHEVGPDHDKVFTVQVVIEDFRAAIGAGKSKKQAEQIAAKNSIDLVEISLAARVEE